MKSRFTLLSLLHQDYLRAALAIFDWQIKSIFMNFYSLPVFMVIVPDQ